MAVGLETGMVIFEDVNSHERVDRTMHVGPWCFCVPMWLWTAMSLLAALG